MLDDRLAAFEAGRQAGLVEGRFSALEAALDAQALRQAADLIEWVRTRTLGLATGPNWAEMVGGEIPAVTR